VVDKGDDVGTRVVDAGVARGVYRSVGHLDEHVHVVAFPHHPGGAVRGGAVDDDNFRIGNEIGNRVQRPR